MKHKMELLFDGQTGALRLDGPLENKVLCLGMLQLAMITIGGETFKAKEGVEAAQEMPGELVKQ